MIKYDFYYWGPLLFKTKLTNDNLKKVKSLCKKDPKRLYIKSLAGNIQHEYTIDSDKLNQILQPYIKAFKEAYVHWYNKPIDFLYVKSSWVNYMQPGDYNPVP